MAATYWTEEQIDMLLTTLESIEKHLGRIADSLERIAAREAPLSPAE